MTRTPTTCSTCPAVIGWGHRAIESSRYADASAKESVMARISDSLVWAYR